MPGWIDKILGVTDDTRAESERRKTYTQVLNHLPSGGMVNDRRPDGTHLKIYIAHTRSVEPA